MIFGFYLEMCYFKKQIVKVCVGCKSNFTNVADRRCLFCGNTENHKKCKQCQRLNRTVPHIALYMYNDAMKDYITAFKISGGYHLKYVFEAELKVIIKQLGNPMLVPIPITKKAYEERGFNQVEALLGEKRVVPLLTCIQEQRLNQKSLNRAQRLNRQQPFQMNPAVICPDKTVKICIVDDIYTTGQTINHAIECLQQQGFSNLISLSLAR